MEGRAGIGVCRIERGCIGDDVDVFDGVCAIDGRETWAVASELGVRLLSGDGAGLGFGMEGLAMVWRMVS